MGFLVEIDTCNSWYLYSLECYWTSCSSYNEHPMWYIIVYIWCNSHATICNFFATNNLHVKFAHTFQHGERNANMTFHPFVNKWRMLIPFATYLQLFYNQFNKYIPLLFHSSIWQMDYKYPSLLQLIYNYFITSLTNIFLIISFIHLSNEFVPILCN